MADRRHIKRDIKRLQRVKTWQLIIVLVISGFLAATFLRLNNIGMVERREAVLAADKDGNDGDAADRMYDLQRYVAAHMNANTGQFDLTNQYNRDVQKAITAATDDSNPNGNINAKAEAVCRKLYPTYQAGTYLQYQQCFLGEISKYPPAPNPSDNFTPPNPALYRHDFASPLWSPDFAGFSVLVFLAIALIIIVRLISLAALYLLLKYRYRNQF